MQFCADAAAFLTHASLFLVYRVGFCLSCFLRYNRAFGLAKFRNFLPKFVFYSLVNPCSLSWLSLRRKFSRV